MTATAGAPLTRVINWKSIIWITVEDHVNRLQLRIAKAIKMGRYGRAKALQWLLTHSFYAKLLAIKKVTQNAGKYIFNDIDKVIFDSLWSMLKSKHSNKNLHWIRNKYFTRIGERNWCFFCKVKTKTGTKIYTLIQAVKTKNKKRHLKINDRATPFDQDFNEYFIVRENRLKRERINSRIINNHCLKGA
jgi:hypothetical protein